jgi:uncharacterized membrane protein
MLWWVGLGLLFVWLVLLIAHPSGWIHVLLLSGISVLVVQTAAYRKMKALRRNRQ